MQIRHDLFDATEDELLVAIGAQLPRGARSALPETIDELRERGRAWVTARVALCRSAICGNDTVHRLSTQGFSAELVAAAAALVESLALGTASSALVILLCKRGLGELCRGERDK